MNSIFIHTSGIKEININDIELFYNINKKNQNDKSNKQREYIILAIVNKQIPNKWLKNEKWNKLNNNIWKFIKNLYNDYDKTDIFKVYKGSRCNNFDFQLYDSNTNISYNIEFKYNIDKIIKSPEFLSLSSKDILINNLDYSEYFYDNYVSKIAKLYNIENLIPPKNTYLKNIFSVKYDIHPFFNYLYKNENLFKKEKNIITKESISNYLKTIKNIFSFNFNILNEKLKKQENKIYMCYKNDNIYFDKIDKDELIITDFIGIKNNNVIILQTKLKTTQLHLLLRWKNHNSVLFCAYQISLHR